MARSPVGVSWQPIATSGGSFFISRGRGRRCVTWPPCGTCSRRCGCSRQNAIRAAVRHMELLVLDRLYSPTDAAQLAQAARDKGLRVEVRSADAVSHVPYNDRTKSALIIDDDALALAVVNRMLRESVSIRIAEDELRGGRL